MLRFAKMWILTIDYDDFSHKALKLFYSKTQIVPQMAGLIGFSVILPNPSFEGEASIHHYHCMDRIRFHAYVTCCNVPSRFKAKEGELYTIWLGYWTNAVMQYE